MPRTAILKTEVGPSYALRVGPFYALTSTPPGNGFPRETEQVSDIGFGEAEFTPVNGTQAERFEDFIGQLTGVG